MPESGDIGDEISVAPRRAVPGTEQLIDTGHLVARHRFIQHGRDRILPIPEPSLTDPNDPLRWPKLKKWMTLLNGLAYSFMGSVTGPIMAAMMIPLSDKYHTSLQRLTYANGATLVCQGVGNVFWMPLALKFGRRPVYMSSNVLMGVACVWLGLATEASYTPFVIGRAFLGLFEAPIESIVPSTITDVFFLHDRGEKVSLYGFSVLSGNELGPLFSALIIQHLGMNWAFYIVAMFIALSCVTMFLSMPETKYTGPRPTYHLEEEMSEHVKESQVQTIESKEMERNDPILEQQQMSQRSFIQEMALFRGADPNISFYKVFLRPFILVTYPTVLWASLVYAMSLGWNVILGATVAQLFEPQYGFGSQAQGLVFLSPFIGSLIGTYLCGSLSDSVANFFTRRNDGVREPEMRLPIMIVATLLTVLGALMSSLTYEQKTHWAGPIVGFGVLSAGAQMGVSLSMSYALDCHRELSVELMVTVASLKSLIAWIWTWVINDWISADGMLTVFMVIAAVNAAIHCTTLWLYFRGKSIRIWIHHENMFSRFGLD